VASAVKRNRSSGITAWALHDIRRTMQSHTSTRCPRKKSSANPSSRTPERGLSSWAGCYDAVAIARAAGFRMLLMSRIRHAAIRLEAGQKERPKYREKSL